MWPNVIRVILSAVILVTVAEVSQRLPRIGALLLSLPVVSILAFFMAWTRFHDLPAASRMARETLVLVPSRPGAGRSLATSVALGWLWLVEGVSPQRTDVIGVALCLAGMAVIMLAPR